METSLLAYAERSNETAKPFRWMKNADEILHDPRSTEHSCYSRRARVWWSDLKFVPYRSSRSFFPTVVPQLDANAIKRAFLAFLHKKCGFKSDGNQANRRTLLD